MFTKKLKIIWVFIFFIPLVVFAFYACSKKSGQESSSTQNSRKIDYYTCSMHPFIHEHKPGNCPICGMKQREFIQVLG